MARHTWLDTHGLDAPRTSDQPHTPRTSDQPHTPQEDSAPALVRRLLAIASLFVSLSLVGNVLSMRIGEVGLVFRAHEAAIITHQAAVITHQVVITAHLSAMGSVRSGSCSHRSILSLYPVAACV